MDWHEIVRVWGTADEFDIEFQHEGGTRWFCLVPPDTEDGVYAVEIHALNRSGKVAHWVGELFMSSGICHLSITEPDFVFWFDTDDMALRLEEDTSDLILAKCRVSSAIKLSDTVTAMILEKGCPHKKAEAIR